MSRRRKSSAVTILAAIISLFIWYGQSQNWFASALKAPIKSAKTGVETAQPGMYHITRFSDGDTITVNMNGTDETIRFVGVDTPETHDPRKKVQCYGPAASAFTKNTLTAAGSTVKLAADSLSSNRDRYNRLLRYVYLPDGTLLNLKLIQEGYGFYYPYFPFSKSDEFSAAEKQAQDGRKGLWGNCTPKPTDGGGYTSNDQ
jgi:micrococcal nuclease